MLKIIGGLTVFFAGVILHGWTLAVLWTWFVVSAFPAIPRLSIPAAMGFCLVVRYVTYESEASFETRTSEENRNRLIRSTAIMFIKPLIVLAFGWVLLFFI